jgi:hypothetical protein
LLSCLRRAIVRRKTVWIALSLFAVTCSAILSGAQSLPFSTSPVSVSVYDRSRVDALQWFAAPPQSETYSYFNPYWHQLAPNFWVALLRP